MILSTLRLLAKAVEEAERTLTLEMRAARVLGVSLRDIAEATGTSHERVRRMTVDEPANDGGTTK